jgi:hypothetical protein
VLRIIIASAILATAAPAAGQMPDPAPIMAAEREAMKIFDWMNGQWRGHAVHRGPGGEKRVIHTERSGPMLGGTVRMVEGRAYQPDGSTAFNALAMISFDPDMKAYRMASHADGRFGVFKIEPSVNGYVWSVPAGAATVRYTGTFKDGLICRRRPTDAPLLSNGIAQGWRRRLA